MNPGSPTTNLYAQYLAAAGKQVGATVTDVPSGSSASSVGSAFDAVAQQRPNGVIVAGTPPELFQAALKSFQRNHIPVVSTGVIDSKANGGLTAYTAGRAYQQRLGRLIADFAYTQHANSTNAVVYYSPEISYTPIATAAFVAELNTLCAKHCPIRTVSIPFASWGSTAPSLITNSLQAHAGTNTAFLTSSGMLLGLPSALNSAGVKVDIYTSPGTDPTSLQYVKAGEVAGVLGLDARTQILQALDLVLRSAMKQPLTAKLQQQAQEPVQEFLTKANVNFDPAGGWEPYPNYQQRFVNAWEGK